MYMDVEAILEELIPKVPNYVFTKWLSKRVSLIWLEDEDDRLGMTRFEEGNAESNEDSTDDDEGSHKVVVEETKPMKMVRVEPIKLDVQKSTSMIDDDPIKEEFFSVPDEWKIDAQDPDLEAIYSSEEKVVEVVHSSDDDVVIYDHEESNPHVQKNLTYNNPIEKSLLSLELHPAKAMNVNVGSDSELSLELEKVYFAIENNSWADAAISFQKLASRMPGDSAVFNNYGLSLLQRAIQMACLLYTSPSPRD